MEKSTPYYSVLRTKIQRALDLQAVDGHNNRTISVPFADTARPDGVELLRLNGASIYNAVVTRIQESGAKWPLHKHAVAFEVFLGLSPDSPQQPSDDLFFERSVAFLDRTFGAENVVTIHGHRDEKTPHVHAIVTPICEGTLPGCPMGDDEPKKGLIVSWNQYSGSNEINYRDPEKKRSKKEGMKPKRKHRRSNRVKPEKPIKRTNDRMAKWQTDWAETWKDHGYRRGIPSKREHMPIQWIHGELAAIAGKAEAAKSAIAEAIQTFALTPWDLFMLREKPTNAVISEALQQRLMPLISEHQKLLVALAALGLQLDDERKSRVSLEDEIKVLKAQLANPASGPDAARGIEELRAENQRLKQQIQSAAPVAILPPIILRPLPTPKVPPQKPGPELNR